MTASKGKGGATKQQAGKQGPPKAKKPAAPDIFSAAARTPDFFTTSKEHSSTPQAPGARNPNAKRSNVPSARKASKTPGRKGSNVPSARKNSPASSPKGSKAPTGRRNSRTPSPKDSKAPNASKNSRTPSPKGSKAPTKGKSRTPSPKGAKAQPKGRPSRPPSSKAAKGLIVKKTSLDALSNTSSIHAAHLLEDYPPRSPPQGKLLFKASKASMRHQSTTGGKGGRTAPEKLKNMFACCPVIGKKKSTKSPPKIPPKSPGTSRTPSPTQSVRGSTPKPNKTPQNSPKTSRTPSPTPTAGSTTPEPMKQPRTPPEPMKQPSTPPEPAADTKSPVSAVHKPPITEAHKSVSDGMKSDPPPTKSPFAKYNGAEEVVSDSAMPTKVPDALLPKPVPLYNTPALLKPVPQGGRSAQPGASAGASRASTYDTSSLSDSSKRFTPISAQPTTPFSAASDAGSRPSSAPLSDDAESPPYSPARKQQSPPPSAQRQRPQSPSDQRQQAQSPNPKKQRAQSPSPPPHQRGAKSPPQPPQRRKNTRTKSPTCCDMFKPKRKKKPHPKHASPAGQHGAPPKARQAAGQNVKPRTPPEKQRVPPPQQQGDPVKKKIPIDNIGPQGAKNAPPDEKKGPSGQKNAPPDEKKSPSAQKNEPPGGKNVPPGEKTPPPDEKNLPVDKMGQQPQIKPYMSDDEPLIETTYPKVMILQPDPKNPQALVPVPCYIVPASQPVIPRSRIHQLRPRRKSPPRIGSPSLTRYQRALTNAKVLGVKSQTMHCPVDCRPFIKSNVQQPFVPNVRIQSPTGTVQYPLANRLPGQVSSSNSAPMRQPPACCQPAMLNYNFHNNNLTDSALRRYSPTTRSYKSDFTQGATLSYIRPMPPVATLYDSQCWAPLFQISNHGKPVYNQTTFPSLAKYPQITPTMGFNTKDLSVMYYRYLYNPGTHANLRDSSRLGSMLGYRTMEPVEPKTLRTYCSRGG